MNFLHVAIQDGKFMNCEISDSEISVYDNQEAVTEFVLRISKSKKEISLIGKQLKKKVVKSAHFQGGAYMTENVFAQNFYDELIRLDYCKDTKNSNETKIDLNKIADQLNVSRVSITNWLQGKSSPNKAYIKKMQELGFNISK